jgi:hypothetical protein
MLVTFSKFAEIKGVSPAAVSIACKSRIKDAIVERNGKRMLDRDKALELWDRNTKRNGSERVSAEAKERDRKPLEPGADPPPPAQVPAATGEQLKTLIMGLPEDQIPGLDVSRERKEHYNAEIARLQALKEREELVPTADVKRMASTLGRQIRDNILSIPNRVAPLLAAAQDSGEVHRLLSEELRTALRALADG